MVVERGETVHLEYDDVENILYFSFPNVEIESAEGLVMHFGRMVSFWRRHCGGRKVYSVVNYDGLQINARLTDVYATQLQRIVDFSIAIVRYGGSSLQRTSSRLANMKLHTASRICSSREEALEIVRALKASEMAVVSPAR